MGSQTPYLIKNTRCSVITQIGLTSVTTFRKMKHIIMKLLIDLVIFVISLIKLKKRVEVFCAKHYALDGLHFALRLLVYTVLTIVWTPFFQNFSWCYNNVFKARYISFHFDCNALIYLKIIITNLTWVKIKLPGYVTQSAGCKSMFFRSF